VKQAISVLKKRSGSHERSIRELIFSNGRISLGPALAEFEGVLTGVPKLRGPLSDLSGETSIAGKR
jgi:circadian clock protein KaiC